MLFRLDPSLYPATGHGVIDGVQNIATSVHEGAHVVTGRASLLRLLSETGGLSMRASSALALSASRASETLGLCSVLSTYVDVVAGNGCRRTGGVWTVGVEYFATSDRVQSTRLFAEAADDVELFTMLAQAAMIPGYTARFTSVPVGGGNYCNVWPESMEGSPALGVVDSERASKGAKLGGTAGGALVAEAGLKTVSVRELHVLDVHEAENLLSETLVSDLWSTGDAAERASNAIKAGWVGSAHGYVDLKDKIAEELLPRALAHLRTQSAAKRRELLLKGRGAPHPELPGKLAAWGFGGDRVRS